MLNEKAKETEYYAAKVNAWFRTRIEEGVQNSVSIN